MRRDTRPSRVHVDETLPQRLTESGALTIRLDTEVAASTKRPAATSVLAWRKLMEKIMALVLENVGGQLVQATPLGLQVTSTR